MTSMPSDRGFSGLKDSQKPFQNPVIRGDMNEVPQKWRAASDTKSHVDGAA